MPSMRLLSSLTCSAVLEESTEVITSGSKFCDLTIERNSDSASLRAGAAWAMPVSRSLSSVDFSCSLVRLSAQRDSAFFFSAASASRLSLSCFSTTFRSSSAKSAFFLAASDSTSLRSCE